nr:MAG TPA: hypothetical protein [Caudoviricetes sp.]
MTLGQGVKAAFSSIQTKFSSEDATEWLSNWDIALAAETMLFI